MDPCECDNPPADHAEAALRSPAFYCGSVENAELGVIPIIRAAEHMDCGPIISRVGHWVITDNGVECLRIRFRIPKSSIHREDWFRQAASQPWFMHNDEIDLPCILELARQCWPRPDDAPPPPAPQ